jgi:hypothetical protein
VEHLRLAIAFMMMLSVVTFVLTSRVLSRASSLTLNVAAVITMLLIAAYVYLVWGQLWIVNWIPLPAVVVLSNWFPILLAVLAAILWQQMASQSFWRKAPAQLVLMSVTVWTVMSALPYAQHECGDEWIPATDWLPWRICLQTTDHTCSAASAATLLDALGIPASENEMSELCLTRRGTTWLGMYHGISIKLMGTPFRVRFFEGSIDELINITKTRPVLLCCELSAEVAAHVPKYQQEDGWIPGVLHSVVCFGALDADSFIIGDPSQPRVERWSRRDLVNLWSGTGLMITTADDRAPAAPGMSVE